MNDKDTQAVLDACDLLAHRIITVEDKYHKSPWLFYQCMRAFDDKDLPAEAITFSVFINSPVMKPGEATIYRDGRLEMRIIHEEDEE